MENSLKIMSNEKIKEQIKKFDKKIYMLNYLQWLSWIVMFIGFFYTGISKDWIGLLIVILGGISYLENMIAISTYSAHQEIWINKLENRVIKDKVDWIYAQLDFLDLKYDNDRLFKKMEKDAIENKLKIKEIPKYKK